MTKEKKVEKEVTKPLFTSQHLFMGLLVALIAYQITMLKDMATTLTTLESRLKTIEIYMNSVDLTPKKSHLYDIPTHAPHAIYKIATQSNDSRVPLDPNKTYSYDDFESVFHVKPLHVQVLTDDAKELLKGHDPKTDEYFLDFKDDIMANYEDFTKWIDEGSHEQRDRDLYEIKWASIQSGFGLFAKKDIKAGEIVGLYGGVVTTDVENTEYF